MSNTADSSPIANDHLRRELRETEKITNDAWNSVLGSPSRRQTSNRPASASTTPIDMARQPEPMDISARQAATKPQRRTSKKTSKKAEPTKGPDVGTGHKRTPSPSKKDPPAKRTSGSRRSLDVIEEIETVKDIDNTYIGTLAEVNDILLLKANAKYKLSQLSTIVVDADQTLDPDSQLDDGELRWLKKRCQKWETENSKLTTSIRNWRHGAQPMACMHSRFKKKASSWDQVDKRNVACGACPKGRPPAPCVVFAWVEGVKTLLMLPDKNGDHDYFDMADLDVNQSSGDRMDTS